MNGFLLKVIAIIAMTIDHLGIFIFPQYAFMRHIGKLTMPIMAFFIAQGLRHTRSVDRYARRLLIFAIISIIPYFLLFGYLGNVLFTLYFAVRGVTMHNKLTQYKHGGYLKLPVLALYAIFPTILLCDWIGFGVLCVYAFYFAGEDKLKITVNFTGLIAVFLGIIMLSAATGIFWEYTSTYMAHIFVMAALPLILLYNGKRGANIKYFFYIYYPLHMLAIYMLCIFG